MDEELNFRIEKQRIQVLNYRKINELPNAKKLQCSSFKNRDV